MHKHDPVITHMHVTEKLKQSEKQEQKGCKNGLVSGVLVIDTFLKLITDEVRGGWI